MSDNIPKEHQYASLISAKILELFDSEKEGAIPDEDFNDNQNVTHFMHALANLVPTYMYFQITGDHKTGIDFNHLANKLVFQYSKLVEEPPKEEEEVG